MAKNKSNSPSIATDKKADTKDKLIALEAARSQMDKQYGKGALMKLSDSVTDPTITTISSGSILLDEALGVGGFPRGRIIEIYGPESSGKTTLSLHAIAEAQKAGGIAAFIDARARSRSGIRQKNRLSIPMNCGSASLTTENRPLKSPNHSYEAELSTLLSLTRLPLLRLRLRLMVRWGTRIWDSRRG